MIRPDCNWSQMFAKLQLVNCTVWESKMNKTFKIPGTVGSAFKNLHVANELLCSLYNEDLMQNGRIS